MSAATLVAGDNFVVVLNVIFTITGIPDRAAVGQLFERTRPRPAGVLHAYAKFSLSGYDADGSGTTT